MQKQNKHVDRQAPIPRQEMHSGASAALDGDCLHNLLRPWSLPHGIHAYRYEMYFLHVFLITASQTQFVQLSIRSQRRDCVYGPEDR